MRDILGPGRGYIITREKPVHHPCVHTCHGDRLVWTCASAACAPAPHLLPSEPGCMGMARIPPSCALLSTSPCWGLGRGVTLSSGDAFLCVAGIGRSGTAAQRLCLTSLTCKLRQMWRKSFSLFQPLPNSVAIFRLAVRAEKGFLEEEMRCLISCGVRSKERPT